MIYYDSVWGVAWSWYWILITNFIQASSWYWVQDWFFLLATMSVQIYKHDVEIGIRQVYTWYYLRCLPNWYQYKVGSALVHPGLGPIYRSDSGVKEWNGVGRWLIWFFHNFNPLKKKTDLVSIRLPISMSKQNWVPDKLSIFGG
jgi:hypothetical protein